MIQGSVNYSPFYWNAVISTHLHITYNCFPTAIAELSSCNPLKEKFVHLLFRYSTKPSRTQESSTFYSNILMSRFYPHGLIMFPKAALFLLSSNYWFIYQATRKRNKKEEIAVFYLPLETALKAYIAYLLISHFSELFLMTISNGKGGLEISSLAGSMVIVDNVGIL